jgi:hypothetical protein
MSSVESLKKITKKNFVDALKNVRPYEEEWMKEREEELVKVLKLGLHTGNSKANGTRNAKASVTAKDLPLVTTLFKCDGYQCKKLLYYPRVLVHNCLGCSSDSLKCMKGMSPIVLNFFFSIWYPRIRPWTADKLCAVSTIPGPLRKLLNVCGVDLKESGKTRTWEDLLRQGGEMEETVFRVKMIQMGKCKDKSVASLAYLVSVFLSLG